MSCSIQVTPGTPDHRRAGHAMTDHTTLVVCDGDETGQELLEQALRVLEERVLGLPIELVRFDLSLANGDAPTTPSSATPLSDARSRIGVEGGHRYPRESATLDHPISCCARELVVRYRSDWSADSRRRTARSNGHPIVVVRMASATRTVRTRVARALLGHVLRWPGASSASTG